MRSEVPRDSRAAETAEVTAELEAMITIARALTRLPNHGGRQRVLNWALDRFSTDPVVTVSAPAAATAPPPDPSLTLPGATDLFGTSRRALRAADSLDEPLDDLYDVLPPAVFDDDEIAEAFAARRARRIIGLVADVTATCRRLVIRIRHPYTFGLLNRI